MQKVKVQYEHDNSVAKITLHDGTGGNILDNKMMTELTDFLASVRHMPSLKLITFEGEGKHFSFGASVAEHTRDQSEKMLETFHGLFYTLMDINIPTLARISGQCLGGGFELPLACHFIFTDKTAKIGQPEIVLGVFAPPASIMLPMRVGFTKAEELLLTGKIIGAEEAKQIGLVNDVFEDKETMNAALDEWIAKYILPRSASSLRYAVRAVRKPFNQTMRTYMPMLTDLYNKEMMKSHDANEGINAFIEKRKPTWKNH